MYLTDKHYDLITDRMAEINKRLEAEGDTARVWSYSIVPDPDMDHVWVIYVKLEVPDDYFPEMPTVRETLQVWPIERTDRHRDLLDELFAEDTYPQFDTVPFHYTRSELLEDDDMSAHPQPELAHG